MLSENEEYREYRTVGATAGLPSGAERAKLPDLAVVALSVRKVLA